MEESRRDATDLGRHGRETKKYLQGIPTLSLGETSRENPSYIPQGSCRQRSPEVSWGGGLFKQLKGHKKIKEFGLEP